MERLRILTIVGSTREGRFGDKPARFIHDFLSQDERIDATLVDLRDFPLPLFDRPMGPSRITDGNYGNDVANRWAETIAPADGFVFTAAEYNHGYTPSLKNALDWIYAEWKRKPVSFVGYGNVGGARAVEQLRQVVVELQMVPLKFAVHIPGPVFMAARNQPAPVDPAVFAPVEHAAAALRDDLVWWASALREARRKPAP